MKQKHNFELVRIWKNDSNVVTKVVWFRSTVLSKLYHVEKEHDYLKNIDFVCNLA